MKEAGNHAVDLLLAHLNSSLACTCRLYPSLHIGFNRVYRFLHIRHDEDPSSHVAREKLSPLQRSNCGSYRPVRGRVGVVVSKAGQQRGPSGATRRPHNFHSEGSVEPLPPTTRSLLDGGSLGAVTALS